MEEYKTLVKLLANGKITIPIGVRDILNLREGEYLEICIKRVESV